MLVLDIPIFLYIKYGPKLFSLRKSDLEVPNTRLLGNIRVLYDYSTKKKNYNKRNHENKWVPLNNFVCDIYKCNCQNNFEKMANFLAHIAMLETKIQIYMVEIASCEDSEDEEDSEDSKYNYHYFIIQLSLFSFIFSFNPLSSI